MDFKKRSRRDKYITHLTAEKNKGIKGCVHVFSRVTEMTPLYNVYSNQPELSLNFSRTPLSTLNLL